ncbi:MAG: hypothetical protein ACXVI9_09375 [Mucilaginibacter sp.]
MAKIELGDIFEIETAKGKAYFQCVKIDKSRGDLIKVFNKLYHERAEFIESVIKVKDNYFIGFPLGAAYRRKLIEKVGNISLPDDFELPKYMRSKHVIQGRFFGWHIINTSTWKRQLVEKLSEEQKQLSPWGIWNDTLLKESLESGWNLEKWN